MQVLRSEQVEQKFGHALHIPKTGSDLVPVGQVIGFVAHVQLLVNSL